MTELISLNQILVLAISNIISGVFIGIGIAGGLYHTLKKQMPKWIHEINSELRKMTMIDKALTMQKDNQSK